MGRVDIWMELTVMHGREMFVVMVGTRVYLLVALLPVPRG